MRGALIRGEDFRICSSGMRTLARKLEAPPPLSAAMLTTSCRVKSGPRDGANSIPHLQRTIGNRAVQLLVEAHAVYREGESTVFPQTVASSPGIAIQGWWFWGPSKPAPSPDDDLPKPPAGYQWKKPEVARRFLKNYDADIRNLADQFNALSPLQSSLNSLKTMAVDEQRVARGELDRIRRNDIWPNWGTLNHALTVIGTVATCLEGSCLIGLALGAISLYHTDAGAVSAVATSCLPSPSKPACAEAIANGAASIVSSRLDEKATSERLSDKERAQRMLEHGRQAEAYFNDALAKLDAQRDPIRDRMLFLSRAYDYALWGRDEDNPFDQKYKVEQPI